MNLNASYEVFEETKEIESVGRLVTFGIVAAATCGRADLRVSDISTNRSVVEQLADECNRHDVSPMHFMDILEDFWGRHVV